MQEITIETSNGHETISLSDTSNIFTILTPDSVDYSLELIGGEKADLKTENGLRSCKGSILNLIKILEKRMSYFKKTKLQELAIEYLKGSISGSPGERTFESSIKPLLLDNIFEISSKEGKKKLKDNISEIEAIVKRKAKERGDYKAIDRRFFIGGSIFAALSGIGGVIGYNLLSKKSCEEILFEPKFNNSIQGNEVLIRETEFNSKEASLKFYFIKGETELNSLQIEELKYIYEELQSKCESISQVGVEIGADKSGDDRQNTITLNAREENINTLLKKLNPNLNITIRSKTIGGNNDLSLDRYVKIYF